MKKILFLVLALIYTFSISSQNKEKDSVTILNNSFSEFFSKGDTANASLVAQQMRSYALRNNDSLTLMRVQNYFFHLSTEDNRVNYLDSAQRIASKLNLADISILLTYNKCHYYYYTLGDLKHSTEYTLDGLELARELKNEKLEAKFLILLGLINLENINKEHVSLKQYKKAEIINTKLKDNDLSFSIKFGLASIYRKLNKLDSSNIYINQGLELSTVLKDTINYNYFDYLRAVNLYMKNNINEALPIFDRVYSTLDYEKDYPNLIEINYFLGKIYREKNNSFKSIHHFTLMDNYFDKHAMYSKELRNGYQEIIKHYRNKKNYEKESYYKSKLTKIDSIYINDYKKILNSMLDFSKEKSITNEENLSNKLNETKDISNFKSYILVFFLFSIILIILYFRKKQKDFKEKFEGIINKTEETKAVIEPIKEDNKQTLSIEQSIIEDVLSKLTDLEEKEFFLDTKINLTGLSKKLGHNSKYVSAIINEYKKSTVINYINQLRINYCVDRLKSDAKFRKYTIESIANDSGFNTTRSFNNAFKKIHEITASAFIKELLKGGKFKEFTQEKS